MMSKRFSKPGYLLLVVLAVACRSYRPSLEQAAILKIYTSAPADTSILSYYKPFKDSLDKIMKIPVAELDVDLVKKLPESTLGNMMADILLEKTRQYTGDRIDVGILNYGGIRTPSLTKGMLTIEHAYLLMPFDNYLVEQVLSGSELSAFCDSMAMKKGWPVSGLSFLIKDGRASSIRINGEPLGLSKTYTVALSDYIANGGDGMAFLKSIPQKQTGVLFRDAIIEYWKERSAKKMKISSKLENRIAYAE